MMTNSFTYSLRCFAIGLARIIGLMAVPQSLLFLGILGLRDALGLDPMHDPSAGDNGLWMWQFGLGHTASVVFFTALVLMLCVVVVAIVLFAIYLAIRATMFLGGWKPQPEDPEAASSRQRGKIERFLSRGKSEQGETMTERFARQNRERHAGSST